MKTTPLTIPPLNQNFLEHSVHGLSEDNLLNLVNEALYQTEKVNLASPSFFLECCKKNYPKVIAKIMSEHDTPNVDFSFVTIDEALKSTSGQLEAQKEILLHSRALGWTVLQRHVDQYLKSAILQDLPNDISFIMSCEDLGVRATFFDLEESGVSCYSLSCGTAHVSLVKAMVASGECFLSEYFGKCPLTRSLQKGNGPVVSFWIKYFSAHGLEEKMAEAFFFHKNMLNQKSNFYKVDNGFWDMINQALSECPLETRAAIAQRVSGEVFMERLPVLPAALSKTSLIDNLPGSSSYEKKPRQI